MTTKLFATPFDWTLTFLRIIVGGVMLAHGAQKMLGWFGGPGYAASMEMFGQMGIPSGQGSKLETWLQARTNPPSAGRFSTPLDRSR